MDQWKTIGGVALGSFEDVALYMIYCIVQNQELNMLLSIIWATLGAIIGCLLPFVAIIIFALLLVFLRVVSKRKLTCI